jgi:hypothetical protein
VYNTVEYVPQSGRALKLEQALLLVAFPLNERDGHKKKGNKSARKTIRI